MKAVKPLQWHENQFTHSLFMGTKNVNLQIYLCLSDQCLHLCQAMSFLWKMNDVFVVLSFKLASDRDISSDKFVTFLFWSFVNVSNSQKKPHQNIHAELKKNMRWRISSLRSVENFVVSIIFLWKRFYTSRTTFKLFFTRKSLIVPFFSHVFKLDEHRKTQFCPFVFVVCTFFL